MTDDNNLNLGCEVCDGDEAVFLQDENNNAFVDSKGNMDAMVRGCVITFKVQHCPVCGRRFLELPET